MNKNKQNPNHKPTKKKNSIQVDTHSSEHDDVFGFSENARKYTGEREFTILAGAPRGHKLREEAAGKTGNYIYVWV